MKNFIKKIISGKKWLCSMLPSKVVMFFVEKIFHKGGDDTEELKEKVFVLKNIASLINSILIIDDNKEYVSLTTLFNFLFSLIRLGVWGYKKNKKTVVGLV